MIDSLEMRTARSQIDRYEQELDAVLREHFALQDCCKCDEFLELSAELITRLFRVEETFIAADAEGVQEWTAETDSILKSAFTALAALGEKLKVWMNRVEAAGYVLENRARFCASFEEISNWFARAESYEQSQSVSRERFAKEPW